MQTKISITTLSQGQIYGEKPTLEEFERQLAADPMTRAVEWLVQIVKSLCANLRRAKSFLAKQNVARERESKAHHA